MRFELDSEANEFHRVRFPTRNPIASYLGSRGMPTDAAAFAALDKWGPNTVDVPMPKFLDLLQRQMLAPFFCFQVRRPPRHAGKLPSACVWTRISGHADAR